MSEVKARLWSDFDGTAVEKLSNRNPLNWPRNMLKTGLKGIPGYGSFLQGVENSGVEVAGIVSRRPDMEQRRHQTMRSISHLGLDGFFKSKDIVLAGSEANKGLFVAAQAERGPVGFIDDKPHKVGAAILDAINSDLEAPTHPILLGVVNHAKSQEYMRRLLEFTRSVPTGVNSEAYLVGSGNPAELVGFSIRRDDSLALRVVQLAPYSAEAGERFGLQLQDLAIK